MMASGDKIKEIRVKLGLDRSELAEKINVAASCITRWEKKERIATAKNKRAIVDLAKEKGYNYQYSDLQDDE